MPREVPEDVWKAALAHALEVHGLELTRGQIGRPKSRRDRVLITWEEGDAALGPLIRCRRCPPGFERYFVDMFARTPTQRALPHIHAHFAETHRTGELGIDEISYQGNERADAKATWLPATPNTPPMIVCSLCPDGMNRISLGTPLYGDARRLRALLRQRPNYYELTSGMDSQEQASWLEAHDRGLPQRRQAAEARRALARARQQRGPEAEDPLASALRHILRRRTDEGEGITGVIKDLAALSSRDKRAFAVLVGKAIPDFADPAVDVSTEEFAQAVARFLLLPEGGLPCIGERQLWDLWKEAKDP
jgi:hypothetical protein